MFLCLTISEEADNFPYFIVEKFLIYVIMSLSIWGYPTKKQKGKTAYGIDAYKKKTQIAN